MPRNGVDFHQPIGAALRQARTIRGKSQQQVATAVDVARISYLQWEQDRTHPTPGNLKKVCDYLEVDIESVLAGEVRLLHGGLGMTDTTQGDSGAEGIERLFCLMTELARQDIGFAPDREQAMKWLATRAGLGKLLR